MFDPDGRVIEDPEAQSEATPAEAQADYTQDCTWREDWSNWNWSSWQPQENTWQKPHYGGNDLTLLEDFSGADVTRYRTWKKKVKSWQLCSRMAIESKVQV